MGEKQLETDMIAQVDLYRNAVYVVADGQMTPVDAPPTGFGKQEISWQNGKPTHSEIKYTQRF
ncbi:DUF3954 domain-containing protein [Viridibacillus arvi]|uniref:DUF3954 domain-containing protein n=1 Tax=Viridibacillus arvi TaxID=263475 RepID=UPI003D03222D